MASIAIDALSLSQKRSLETIYRYIVPGATILGKKYLQWPLIDLSRVWNIYLANCQTKTHAVNSWCFHLVHIFFLLYAWIGYFVDVNLFPKLLYSRVSQTISCLFQIKKTFDELYHESFSPGESFRNDFQVMRFLVEIAVTINSVSNGKEGKLYLLFS